MGPAAEDTKRSLQLLKVSNIVRGQPRGQLRITAENKIQNMAEGPFLCFAFASVLFGVFLIFFF
jgi:hypothetical protein